MTGKEWLHSGVRVTSVHFEPTIFMRRRGYESDVVVPDKEKLVKSLKKEGINLVVTRFYKGFGLEAEREEMEDTRELVSICHQHDIKVAVYTQFGTISQETLFLERPEAKDWIQLLSNGQPLYPYAYDNQYFRLAPCVNQQGWRDYIKMLIKHALEYVKADIIYFDNCNVHDGTCHCPVCKKKWQEYLKEKYKDSPLERIKERFGISDFSGVLPPPYTSAWELKEVRDPITQEWIEFRCRSWAESIRDFSRYAKGINPDCLIMTNPGISRKDKSPAARGVYLSFLRDITDMHFVENRNEPGMEGDVLVSKIRGYKLGRAIGQVTFPSGVASEILSAEGLAFSQAALRPASPKIFEFFEQNKEYYLATETIGEVAVVRNFPMFAFNWQEAYHSTELFEQFLIQGRIPFDIIYEDALDEISGYKVLVLPNMALISDRELEKIRGFVAAGGGLVATEGTGLNDGHFRRREVSGLTQIFGIDMKGKVRLTHENGRVVYLSDVGRSEEFGKYRDHLHLKLPARWMEILEEVRWAAKDNLTLRVDTTSTVACELYRQNVGRPGSDGRRQTADCGPLRLLLHLVNYDSRPVEKAVISLRLPASPAGGPAGRRAIEVILLSPDLPGPRAIDFQEEDGKLKIEVEMLLRYFLVVVKVRH